LHVTAIYRRNFKPQIFTDITTPDTKFYSPHTGKESQHLISVKNLKNFENNDTGTEYSIFVY